MRKSTALVFLMLSTLLQAGPLDAVPKSERRLHVDALKTSLYDDVGSGWCGRGVYSVLTSVGLLAKGESANGEDWEFLLRKAGWCPVQCASPWQAPWGSILVYVSDARAGGQLFRGTAGGKFGHVEFVAIDASGRRWFVSDKPRAIPGGTVADNFTRRAWLPPEAHARFLRTSQNAPTSARLSLREF